MKITVITDTKGNVLGTARFPKRKSKNDPVFQPVAKPGQKIQEIELPSHLENVQSAEELHKGLKKHLAK
jgi:hypothetical protein